MAATRNPRAHTVARRWRIPPPLRGDIGFNGPEGIPVLEEIGGALGSLVWGTLRTVTAWIDTPLEERAELFPEDAARRRMAEVLEASPPAVIEGALTDLVSILDKPAEADPAAIGVACTRVARWAQETGNARTAAHFFQAAANSCPTNPTYALSAAKAARDLTDYARAEVWLQRAVGLARQGGCWDVYSETFLAYGIMMRRRGNMPAARRQLDRALKRASRHGYVEIRARVSHELFVTEFECGAVEAAEVWASEAVATYPANDPGLIRLSNDLVHIWIGRGKYSDALRVLEALAPAVPKHLRPHLLGSTAWAAGGSGHREAYAAAREELSAFALDLGVAEAWTEVAKGALCLGRPDEARLALERALRVAAARGEHRIEFLAEELLATCENAKDKRPVQSEIGQLSRTELAAASGSTTALAESVVRALQPA
jgi:tetratricopeptide (TPR) repeat protein